MSQEIDKGHEIPIYSEVCSRCMHLKLKPSSEFTEGHPTGRCKAFPDGIPREIWFGWNQHTSPFEGEYGVQFEPADSR